MLIPAYFSASADRMTAFENAPKNAITVPLGDGEIEEIELIELLFFAYRDFVGDPDRILEAQGFGRAHHRVLYFVNRSPSMSVAELLDILAITKQSLARVLKQLIESGYIVQKTGEHDRRQRLLFPTEAGRALIRKLSAPQSRRISSALRELKAGDRRAIAEFLSGMRSGSR